MEDGGGVGVCATEIPILQEDQDRDPAKITIIITTSPVPSNPSMKMLLQVLDSLALSSPYLTTCPIIIVFDGFTLNPKTEFKSSRISEEQSWRYREFESAVHAHFAQPTTPPPGAAAAAPPQIEVYEERVGLATYSRVTRKTFNPSFQTLSQSIRVGFAFGVRSALAHVNTPYILILQHDWAFTRCVPIEKFLLTLDQDPFMNYIGFVSRLSLDYVNRKTNRAPSIKPEVLIRNGEPFARLFFWYDRPHLARTTFYKTQVFGQKRFKRGDFIEDTFGHTVMADCRSGGLESWRRYGSWLWYPDQGNVPTVRHLNGRRFTVEPGFWTKNESGQCYFRSTAAAEVRSANGEES